MISVTAAIIIRDNLILAARKRAGLHLAGYWEFPGGKLEEGEDPRECLARELEEELGIRCEVGEFLTESVFAYPGKTVRLLGYLTSHTGGNFRLSDHDELRWLEVHRLKTLQWAPADIPLVDALIRQKLCDKTLSYYGQHACAYVEKTINHDMQALHDQFLAHLPAGGHILDLGCGSGRDSRAFLDLGYQVTAIDGSPAIAALASTYLNQEVQVMKLQEIDWQNHFDGIWACGVLVHLPKSEILHSLQRLSDALKSGGMLYFSVKEGGLERWDGQGRFYCDYRETELMAFVQQVFPASEVTITASTSVLNPVQEKWLNIFARRP